MPRRQSIFPVILMNVFRVDIHPRDHSPDSSGPSYICQRLRAAGLPSLDEVKTWRLFYLQGALSRAEVLRIADLWLADPVTECASILESGASIPPTPGRIAVEVHKRPGVMDPVAESTLAELRAAGFDVTHVRTATRYEFIGLVTQEEVLTTVRRALANDCIEQVVLGSAGVGPAPEPPLGRFELRRVPLRDLNEGALEKLSRDAHLFLSVAEMIAIREHFRALGREPTDVELETLAQTWSEHCVHKTLKSEIEYSGAPLPGPDGAPPAAAHTTHRYENLLRDTIARATRELQAAGRGPECLSVFVDNAGVVGFDERYGVAFKVETHNHPSAIEPYGGAATGIGGVIRDVIGCGLGARPIANTDVFCVAPSDWPLVRLPKGVLHPWRVLQGVVHGVADYGNRMGIPTVNGAVYFDPRYLGNPLVYCGCVGLIPRDRIAKAARAGDQIVLIGGRTGRDGIHGATFSSAELTDSHADEFSHAVQIGNAITEKRILDAILRARDADGSCLYTALTDCGAGGLSSAVGEMGAEVGALVDLERVPLKYAGLRYDEIWISEAQERMVLAVPQEQLAALMEIMAEEEVEATVIGEFGHSLATSDTARPQVVLRYQGQVVGDLDMHFLHEGVPRAKRRAEWSPAATPPVAAEPPVTVVAALARLEQELARPVIAAKEWIIRQYDHEVQGGSVVKPLLGRGRGPSDAAVLRPRLDSPRGIAIACGLAPHVADHDPYWMAIAAIDEALRNVIAVGGDPAQTAVLDNFCWGRTDDAQQLGALVRACQACYDAAMAYGVPFISGKDSLNNEYALDAGDVDGLIQTLRELSIGETREARRLRALLPGLEPRIRARGRLSIPPTLLISALSVLADVRKVVTPDLKQPGSVMLLVGGLPLTGFQLARAAAIHTEVASLVREGAICACHDVSDGGWLVALAEMAIASELGVRLAEIPATAPGPFEECCAGYVVEARAGDAVRTTLAAHDVPCVNLGAVVREHRLVAGSSRVDVAALGAAWRRSPA